jgi:hypothetical protein
LRHHTKAGSFSNDRGSSPEERIMTVDRWVRIIAGTFVFCSVTLGYYVSPYFFLFTAFVGLNLFQSGITRWCLMEDILKKIGVAER